jgi:hypothetical protein
MSVAAAGAPAVIEQPRGAGKGPVGTSGTGAARQNPYRVSQESPGRQSWSLAQQAARLAPHCPGP